MDKIVIPAVRRTVTGKQVGVIRREGKLPGVMYGHKFTSIPITMDLREASRLLAGARSSSLVYITLEGSEHAALVREKQRDVIKGTLKHIDFQVVLLTEKIRAKVSIDLTGISPAVRDLNGVAVTGSNSLNIECLPQYLPERLVIDISNLVKVGDGIYVRDLPVSEHVQILDSPDEMLVIVTAGTLEEEEVVEVAAVTGIEEPAVIEKGKKEEEVPEEGAKK
jgi:large subunit ribosomal protein L25